MTDPYKVLGVSRDASEEDIKKAYLALARKYHPDKYTDTDLAELAAEKMKELNAAYEAIQRGGGQRGGDSHGGQYGNAQGPDAYAAVRRMINVGDIAGARRLLEQVPGADKGAEWFFLMGCVEIKCQRYADAARCLDEACRLEPYNTEYRMARDGLRRQTAGYGGGYRTTSGGGSCCDTCCTCLVLDGCCECMGGDLIPGC